MALSIPIVSEFDGKGIDKAIKEFKQLETVGEKAQFAIKKAAIPAAAAQNAVLEAAGTFGTFGKAAGLGGIELAKFSNDFTALASDLASFNNTSPEEAVNAIGAALRGEAEPLRKFGILLNDATLKTAALSLGIYDGNGALTAQQKILAAQQVIYEQTTAAQGDFGRTSDGLANSQRILKAQLQNLQIEIGKGLLPVVQADFAAVKSVCGVGSREAVAVAVQVAAAVVAVALVAVAT
jgi:hypothetical protein